MLHTEVFDKYKKVFYREVPNIDVWHPNGFNSIRIRLKTGEEYIFSFVNDRMWSMETLDNFIKSLTNNKLNGGILNENGYDC